MTKKCTDAKGDHWEFYQDRGDEWRWRRTARNGQIVGCSHEGYKNYKDCLANAKRPGLDREPIEVSEHA